MFQSTMVNANYPWYAILIAFILVFSSIGCIPGIAILRKLKILNWNYAKQIQAEMHGHTQSTAKFIRSVSSVDNDEDFPNGVKPYSDDPENGELPPSQILDDGAVKFHLLNK